MAATHTTETTSVNPHRAAAEAALAHLVGHYRDKGAMAQQLRALADLDATERDRWVINGLLNGLLRIPLRQPTVVREVSTDRYSAKRRVHATVLVTAVLVNDPRQAINRAQLYVDGAPVVADKRAGGWRSHGTKRPGWHELGRHYNRCATTTLELLQD